MRALIQRVKKASVTVGQTTHSSINQGLLILLGVRNGDTKDDAVAVAEKCAALRIFDDADGKMNLSVRDVGGEAMVVSQFTLYGDTRRGNRPSFTEAAPPDVAESLYEHFIGEMKKLLGGHKVHSGVFSAHMDIGLVNDGPVTIEVESKERN